MNNLINKLSIRGRIAYLIMCFERYVSDKYPCLNWKPVSEMMWKICDKNDYIDYSAYRFLEITPKRLFRHDCFANSKFEYMNEDEYHLFISIIPKGDDKLDVLMHSVFDVAIEYAYCGISEGAPDTIPYIEDVEQVMLEANLPLPDIDLVSKYIDPIDWWGDPFDGRYLSVILK